MEDIIISGSIVVYKEDPKILKKSIESFLKLSYKKELIIIDNSPSDELKNFCNKFNDVKYFHMKKNLGFGKGHNFAFKQLKEKSVVHLILNPDIYFFKKDMEDFLKWFINTDYVLAIPQVMYPNEKKQNVVRNIPTPSSLIKRKFINNYDEIIIPNNVIQEIPFAHGCFFAFKNEIFFKLKGFDERFFMYMEDIDIWIRAKHYGKTVINTNYKIYHYFRKGSSANLKLFFYHLISAIKFFKKYKKVNNEFIKKNI